MSARVGKGEGLEGERCAIGSKVGNGVVSTLVVRKCLFSPVTDTSSSLLIFTHQKTSGRATCMQLSSFL